jgi:Lrp/AsnC family transcriptional regulator, regulator for asnA, asnC and gidA
VRRNSAGAAHGERGPQRVGAQHRAAIPTRNDPRQVGPRTVDDTDRRIIACLQESAAQTNTEIAARLGVSESTVRKRRNRLLADDLVKVVAITDPFKIGYPVVAIIGISCSPSDLADVERSLAEIEAFRFIGLTTGAYDFMTEAWFVSFDDLRDFVTQRIAAIPGIQRMEVAHVMKMVRYVYDWGRPQQV